MASQTALQVLNRAMRRIKVLAGEEALAAAEMVDGLVTMNGTMQGFSLRGIKYAHSDLAATDTVNMPDEQIDSLVWLIAEALAPEYGYEFTSQEAVHVVGALRQLQAAYYVPAPAVPDIGLRRARYGWFNFTRGV